MAEPGDTIHLKPTTYFEYAGFYHKKGTLDKPITLDGHGATLDGSDPIDPAHWQQVSPGLYRCGSVLPKLNRAILARWFFLIDGEIKRMGRVLKGKSQPFKNQVNCKPGEWTFIETIAELTASDSALVQGFFYIKVAPDQALETINIRYPARSAGVQLSGDNAHLIIRNLTATHPYNDGFNIHGDCRNVRFENIRAIECADDGISAHETAQYDVDRFISIGNGTGICDTGESQLRIKMCLLPIVSESICIFSILENTASKMSSCFHPPKDQS